MTWSTLLTDRQGVPVAELRNAHQRTLRFVHRRTPTVTFAVDADNPNGPLLLAQDKTLLACFDSSTGSKVLRFRGPVVGYQKTRQSQGSSIAVTAAGLQWRLDHRLVGKNVAGATCGTTSLSLLDRGEIMGRLLDAVNAGEATNIFADADNTAIRRGVITPSAQTYIGPWRYKVLGEAFGDLAGPLDGPDWTVRYADPPSADALGVILGYLDIAPALGTVQPNVAFEYGTGQKNVASWTDTGDASSLANLAVNLPPGYPDTTTQVPIQTTDAPSIADRGLYEAVVSADVQTDDLRSKLVAQHVAVRKVPRRDITFTPIAEDSSVPIEERRVPRLFADYGIGDVVRFRAVERFPVYDTAGTTIDTLEVPTVDALMRVYEAEIALDDNGVASTALTLRSPD